MPPFPIDDIPPIVSDGSAALNGTSGTFTPGSFAVFFYTFSDINGVLYDPSDISVSILDSTDTEVDTIDSADRIELGVFAIAWDIPDDLTAGKYTISVEYVVETDSGPTTNTIDQDFVITETETSIISYRQTASRAYLESLIREAQRIPVFDETVRFNKARTLGELTFPRWNQPAGVKVFVNGELKESGYTVNYYKGQLSFDTALSSYDEVTASYNFRWFDESELDNFLEQGVNVVNIYAPWSSYTINNIPDMWFIAAEYAAAIDAIRSMMLSLQFQQPAKVFGGLDRAKDVFGNLNTLKQNYEDSLKQLLENKKKGPYLGLTKTVTVPEYTLPGGRSRWFRYLFKGGG